MKIYLASSWRNKQQPDVLAVLRKAGHEVYDFRHPSTNVKGFSWSDVRGEYLKYNMHSFIEWLKHPTAKLGFKYDKDALDWCDACVILLPCGRSAHLECGYAAGQGKRTVVYLSNEGFEPELMYLLCTSIVCSEEDLLAELSKGQ